MQKVFQILEPEEMKQLLGDVVNIDLKRTIAGETLQKEELAAKDNAAWVALFDRALAATEQLNDLVRSLNRRLDTLLETRQKG